MAGQKTLLSRLAFAPFNIARWSKGSRKLNNGDIIKEKPHANVGTIANGSKIEADLPRSGQRECMEALDIPRLDPRRGSSVLPPDSLDGGRAPECRKLVGSDIELQL